MSAFLKQLPLVVLALAITAFATVLGYYGHISSDSTLTTLLAVASITGGLTLYTLASTIPNAATIGHLIVALGLFGAVLALSLHNVLSSGQISTFLAPILATGFLASPANALNTTSGTDPATQAVLDALASAPAAPAPAPVTAPVGGVPTAPAG